MNVGPTAEGVIPEPSVERLAQIGEWIDRNGESIYGSQAGPLHGLSWGRTTMKGSTVYLHVFDWPSNGTLFVSGLTVKAARLLASGERLDVAESADRISVPTAAPDPIDTVIAMEVE